MAPLTWRNVAAPDFTRASQIMAQASANWGNAFGGLADHMQYRAEDQYRRQQDAAAAAEAAAKRSGGGGGGGGGSGGGGGGGGSRGGSSSGSPAGFYAALAAAAGDSPAPAQDQAQNQGQPLPNIPAALVTSTNWQEPAAEGQQGFTFGGQTVTPAQSLAGTVMERYSLPTEPTAAYTTSQPASQPAQPASQPAQAAPAQSPVRAAIAPLTGPQSTPAGQDGQAGQGGGYSFGNSQPGSVNADGVPYRAPSIPAGVSAFLAQQAESGETAQPSNAAETLARSVVESGLPSFTFGDTTPGNSVAPAAPNLGTLLAENRGRLMETVQLAAQYGERLPLDDFLSANNYAADAAIDVYDAQLQGIEAKFDNRLTAVETTGKGIDNYIKAYEFLDNQEQKKLNEFGDYLIDTTLRDASVSDWQDVQSVVEMLDLTPAQRFAATRALERRRQDAEGFFAPDPDAVQNNTAVQTYTDAITGPVTDYFTRNPYARMLTGGQDGVSGNTEDGSRDVQYTITEPDRLPSVSETIDNWAALSTSTAKVKAREAVTSVHERLKEEFGDNVWAPKQLAALAVSLGDQIVDHKSGFSINEWSSDFRLNEDKLFEAAAALHGEQGEQVRANITKINRLQGEGRDLIEQINKREQEYALHETRDWRAGAEDAQLKLRAEINELEGQLAAKRDEILEATSLGSSPTTATNTPTATDALENAGANLASAASDLVFGDRFDRKVTLDDFRTNPNAYQYETIPAPNGTAVDHSAPWSTQTSQRSARNASIRSAINSTLRSLPNQTENLISRFQESRLSPSEGAEYRAQRELGAEANAWLDTPQVQDMFYENPALLEPLQEDPVAFYQAVTQQGVSPEEYLAQWQEAKAAAEREELIAGVQARATSRSRANVQDDPNFPDPRQTAWQQMMRRIGIQ